MTSFVHSKSRDGPIKSTHHSNVDINKITTVPISKTNLQTQNITVLDSKETIENGFKVCIIISESLSAPIFDKESNQFTGLLDIRHFLGYILYKLPVPHSGTQEKKIYLKELDKYPFNVLDINSNILELLKYFNSGVHSAFILNEKKQIEMISQLSLIRWMLANIDDLKIGNDKIKDLFHGEQQHKFSKVHSILNTKSVVEALRELYVQNIYGMPILDENKNIVGNISIVDIKEANDNLDKLILPLKIYFKERPIYSISENSTFKELLQIFDSKQIHRIYLMEENKPIGIITITDVLSMLYQHLHYRANTAQI
ncbi:hypothetical protein PPL_07690 [Heterostelium album PN500]|uniref:CBS domain-containing protein n=1 Tax=Heterostelium pallidum (strain ATCC 26659 / Pp 5 / PN500) TaxID=670386 RepID=D3BGN8_HETP5|nr:hypothetical protein PPL_07690 [Heterostelium album PN500]EFA79272.1 hypothetical protein PPL_07690 [Heterostelium album PN500]|eukprot:XP_020431393.1 hypothetical protein PPL_07690 [Heterostelium album PN500]